MAVSCRETEFKKKNDEKKQTDRVSHSAEWFCVAEKQGLKRDSSTVAGLLGANDVYFFPRWLVRPCGGPGGKPCFVFLFSLF